MLYIESLNGCVWRRMEYLVSYSLSKQNWKKIFLRLLSFFFYLLLSLLAFSIWQTVNRIRVCIVCIYIFYDRKMTFRCVCDLKWWRLRQRQRQWHQWWKSFFRSTANVVPMIVVVADFIVLIISIVNTITECFFYGLLIDLCRFNFFLALSFFSIFSYHGFFCSTSYQTVNAPVYFFFFFFFLLKCAIFVFDVKNTRITCLC